MTTVWELEVGVRRHEGDYGVEFVAMTDHAVKEKVVAAAERIRKEGWVWLREG